MSIRFLLGRAGAGKTRACLDAIRSHLRGDPVQGPRLLFLVPEQAALQMERALLSTPDLTVCHRAEVLSFRRLALRVLEQAGPVPARAISEAARAMVFQRLLHEHGRDLRYYRPSPGRAGLAHQLGHTIAEFMREAIVPADLAAHGVEDAAHEAKLHDLALLFQAYLDYLGGRRLDASQHLQIAREHLSACSWLDGAHLWVDGFAVMGGQEKALLVDVARRCAETTLSLLVEPREISAVHAAARDPEDRSLFAPTLQTLRDWANRFRRAGLAIAAPIILDASPPPRFIEAPELAVLERRLFCSPVPPQQPSVSRESDARTGDDLSRDGPVRGPILPDRRLEVEYAVATVLHWVRDAVAPCRFRDVAIIARDLGPYHDLLAAALSARGIPHFVDRRRSIAHHPLVELLRAIVGLAVDPYAQERVRLLLKTGLSPLADEACDELENHLIEHGIQGAAAWHRGDWQHAPRRRERQQPRPEAAQRLAGVNASRRGLIAHLDPWISAAQDPPRRSGAEWAALLTRTLQNWGVDAALKQWTAQATDAGRLAEAEEHRQAWNGVLEFLDDLGFAFADSPLAAAELEELLESGLSELSLGLAPPTIDEVLVGSIERSRHPDLKAAVILGFNDGLFPAHHAEDAILGDEDRRLLASRGLELERSRRERVLDERLLAYIALTRPSRRLLITCAAADEKGKELRPSPYFAELAEFLPGGGPMRIPDPARTRQTWDIHTPRDLGARLAREFRQRPPRETDDLRLRAQWNTVYALARASGCLSGAAGRALSELAPHAEDRLSAQMAERMFGTPLRTSVTALETFAACPFKHFIQHGLALAPRAEAQLNSLDIGALHHAVLEDFVSTTLRDRQDPTEMGPEEVTTRLEESWRRISARIEPAVEATTSRDAYVVRRIHEHVRHVWRAQQAALSAGRTRPRKAEVAFGFETAGALPAWAWTTPKGRRVVVRGFIDRVDLAEWMDETLGVVVDYKSSRTVMDLSKTWHGLSLQLIAYLLVLAEHGQTLAGRPLRPLAALLVNLKPRYRPVSHPREAGDAPEGCQGMDKARGLICASGVDALEQVAPGARAKHFSAHIRKDGAPADSAGNDAVTDEEFDGVLRHVRNRMGELADGILDGDAGVRPCRLRGFSPCSFCDYASVCRYEMGISRTRFLDWLPRDKALSRMGEAPRPPADA